MLEKSGVDREKAGKVAGYFERKEQKGNNGMFEAAIESIIEEREEARRDGMEKGRETGWKEGQEAVARNALAEGLSLEFVQKITGFDMETLKDIQAGMSSL